MTIPEMPIYRDRANNSINNLILFGGHSQHTTMHARERKIKKIASNYINCEEVLF